MYLRKSLSRPSAPPSPPLLLLLLLQAALHARPLHLLLRQVASPSPPPSPLQISLQCLLLLPGSLPSPPRHLPSPMRPKKRSRWAGELSFSPPAAVSSSSLSSLLSDSSPASHDAGDDRFSDLPDTVRLHILSLLPLKDAIRAGSDQISPVDSSSCTISFIFLSNTETRERKIKVIFYSFPFSFLSLFLFPFVFNPSSETDC